MPRHKARNTADCAWSHHQRPADGEWSCHQTARVVFQAAVHTSRVESMWSTAAVSIRRIPRNRRSQADIHRTCVVWLLLGGRSCTPECVPPQMHEAGLPRTQRTRHWHFAHWLIIETNSFLTKFFTNTSHILQQFIADRITNYTFRTRSHNKNLIPETSYLNDRNFLIRNLYKDCY